MEQREATASSQCGDDEWRDPSVGERLALEMKAVTPSTLDLLCAVWDSRLTSDRNFRLLITFVTRLMLSLEDESSGEFIRVCAIKSTLVSLYELWQFQHKGEDEGDLFCTKDDLCGFLRTKVPIRLFRILVDDRMSTRTLEKWRRDYAEYAAKMVARTVLSAFADDSDSDVLVEQKRASPSIEGDDDDDDEPADSMRRGTKKRKRGREKDADHDDDDYGIGGLFEASARRDVDRVSQYVTKLSGGRLFTIRSPGEAGLEVIRVDVYDLKDVVHVDKRNWWRHAKVRSQFLTSTRQDRKKLLLRQLMREVGKDLSGIPGVVRDVKTLLYG